MSLTNLLWVEKYRPKRISECILPDDLKNTFQKFVDDKFVPNLMLCGGPGVGKTTVARAMLDELECDSIMFNGSSNAVNIDTLRNDIQRYASTVSMSFGRKYVILDEADYLMSHIQPALRTFMEEFSKNCGFILTCNIKNRIIQPLHSRCAVIDFKISGKQKAQLAGQFMDRVCMILETEKVKYDKRVVAEVITKYFPDWRRVLNELQRYSGGGNIDAGILAQVVDTDIRDLLAALKDKNFVAMRKWIALNSATDTATLFRRLYDSAHDIMKPDSVPPLVLILADYQYKAAFVVDQEINLTACMTQIMIDCQFK